MMKIRLTIFLLVGVALFSIAAPFRVLAQLDQSEFEQRFNEQQSSSESTSGVLPDCEKTLYQVATNGTMDCPDGTGSCIEASTYNKATHGDIGAVMVNKNCGFSDFVQLFVNLANWGLGIMAVLALFFFIYGGFTLLISGGRTEYVQNGKKILVGTTIGVIVMLTAWAFVGFYTIATTGSTQGLVFPTIPEFAAPWFGKSQTCRERYAIEHSQASCGQNNLHLYCADSVDVDGPVTRLQTLLDRRECQPGAADGCFGDQTLLALKKFEQVNGLEENGVADAANWNALIDDSSVVDCSVEIGCCSIARGTDPETWRCKEDYPETTCEQEGGSSIPGQCPSFCIFE